MILRPCPPALKRGECQKWIQKFILTGRTNLRIYSKEVGAKFEKCGRMYRNCLCLRLDSSPLFTAPPLFFCGELLSFSALSFCRGRGGSVGGGAADFSIPPPPRYGTVSVRLPHIFGLICRFNLRPSRKRFKTNGRRRSGNRSSSPVCQTE